jgi:hypothetical protein
VHASEISGKAFFCHFKVLRWLAPLVVMIMMWSGGIAAEPSVTQYLLFQSFVGEAAPDTGVYHRRLPKRGLQMIAQHIAETVRPAGGNPNRLLGFAVGPIATDQGEDDARSVIRDAFDIALETDMAVALHLDDYMFTAQARWPDGRGLRSAPGVTEWRDWSGAPAGALEIGWLPNVKLPLPLCYENPEVKRFVTYWTKDVIGQEIKQQINRLAQAGKAKLFAGVIVGWESNLFYGYCSLSQLGYSAQNPPADFDRERERILQRHIERWSKGIYDAGIPRDLIFTHITALPKRDYERMSARLPRARIRDIPGSTGFRAHWTAFNDYSHAGFSAYVDDGRFEDIHQAVQAQGGGRWAMAEGTNVVLTSQEGAARSPLDWETYLARSFNHGAMLVNIFGGFQGEGGGFRGSTESNEALAAYRKFLQGAQLIEGAK